MMIDDCGGCVGGNSIPLPDHQCKMAALPGKIVIYAHNGANWRSGSHICLGQYE